MRMDSHENVPVKHPAPILFRLRGDEEKGRQGDMETARRLCCRGFLLVSPSPCLLVFFQRCCCVACLLALLFMPAAARAAERGTRERTFVRALEVFDAA